jgi:hypothetical protein
VNLNFEIGPMARQLLLFCFDRFQKPTSGEAGGGQQAQQQQQQQQQQHHHLPSISTHNTPKHQTTISYEGSPNYHVLSSQSSFNIH